MPCHSLARKTKLLTYRLRAWDAKTMVKVVRWGERSRLACIYTSTCMSARKKSWVRGVDVSQKFIRGLRDNLAPQLKAKKARDMTVQPSTKTPNSASPTELLPIPRTTRAIFFLSLFRN